MGSGELEVDPGAPPIIGLIGEAGDGSLREYDKELPDPPPIYLTG